MSYNVLIASVVSGGTAGGIIGAITNNILTKRREAEAHKVSKQKELTDFLPDWKGKIMTDHASNSAFVYNQELPHLQTKAAEVRNDLGEMEWAKFNELISDFSGFITE